MMQSEEKDSNEKKRSISDIEYLVVVLSILGTIAYAFTHSKMVIMLYTLGTGACIFINNFRENNGIVFFTKVLILTLILTDFVAVFAPYYFQFMGFNVTNMDNSTITISAADATNYMLSSILAIVIGYLYLNLKKE